MKEIVFKEDGRNQRIFETMWRFNHSFWLQNRSPETIANLCQWIRVVILWPLFNTVTLVVAMFVFWSALTYGMRELADPVVSSNIQVASVAIGKAIGVMFLLFLVFVFSIRYSDHLVKKLALQQQKVRSQKISTETPWYALIWTYLIAIKQRVCPVIRFVRDEDKEVS